MNFQHERQTSDRIQNFLVSGSQFAAHFSKIATEILFQFKREHPAKAECNCHLQN